MSICGLGKYVNPIRAPGADVGISDKSDVGPDRPPPRTVEMPEDLPFAADAGDEYMGLLGARRGGEK
jgi:hypothetical protein